MGTRYIFLLTFMFVFVCTNTKGQTCEELLKEYARMSNKGKTEQAEKINAQLKNCNEETQKKANDVKRHALSTQKKRKSSKPFALSEDSVSFECSGAEHVVTIENVNSWTVSTDSPWCSVEKDYNRIIIKCDENITTQKRTAHITVKSGNKNKVIVVINEAAPEMLKCRVGIINFSSKGDAEVVDVNANTKWQIDNGSVPNWVSVDVKDNHIKLKAKANYQGSERFGEIVIRSNSSSTSDIIRIHQGTNEQQFFTSKNNLAFGTEGGCEYIKVQTDAGLLHFDDSDSEPWCRFEQINKDSIKVICEKNENVSSRGLSMIIRTDSQELKIHVSQEAKPIRYMVPIGIRGRALSFGVNVGYLHPMISASSDGNFTGSVVNYSLGDNKETASYSVSGGFTFGVFADIRLTKNFYLIAGVNYLQYSYKNGFKSDVERRIYKTERYYQKGETQNRYSEEYKLCQLEVPILASYRFPVTKMSHIQMNLGPIFNYGLSAKMDINGYTSSESTYYYVIENGQMTNNIYDKSIQSIQDKGCGEFNLYEKYVSFSVMDKDGNTIDKSSNMEDVPLKRLNTGVRLGITYEYYGISLGAEYTYMITNMANKKYWNGNRWRIFDQSTDTHMSNYNQRNHYLGIKIGYTFRY